MRVFILRFDIMYIQIAELATPTSSRLLSPFLDKRDISEELRKS